MSDDEAGTRWWRRALVAVVAAGALVQFLIVATSTVGSFNDSADYRESSRTPAALIDLSATETQGRARPAAPIIDVFGNGLRPGFAVQVLYQVLPDDRSRVVVQGLLAALAWAVLALTLAHLVRRPWARVLVAALTMFAALSPIMTWWHVSIAQESLMLSATLVFLAALVSVVFPEVPLAGFAIRPNARIAVLVGAFTFAAISRPPSAVLLGALALGVLAFAFLRRDLRRAVAVGGVCTVVVMGWSALVLANNAGRWNEQQAVERFAARMVDRDYVALARREGMPRCHALDEAIELTRQGQFADYVAPIIGATARCPALRTWFEDGGLEPQEVLLHDPGLFARQYWDALDFLGTHPGLKAKSFGGSISFVADGRIVHGEIPDLPDPLAGVQKVLWSPAGLLPVLAVLIALAAIVVGIARRGVRRFAPELALLAWTVVCSAAYYALVWAQAGMEPTRHALPLQLVLTIVVWIVVLRAFTPVSAPRDGEARQPRGDRAADAHHPAPSA